MDESKQPGQHQQPLSVLGGQQLVSLRSAQQHYNWKNQLGFLIHPKIEINIIPDHLSIAEIGTGTGVWLLDLAKNLHAPVKLGGFDTDISLAPPPQWLPDNITIEALDDYANKVPEHLIQAYDIVHVANIASTIKDNNPGAVIKNVMAML
ncbi:MAG: hypothetical protein Q9211_006737, partial [Gyalolechia sp. 1 TL-2023]